MPRKPRYYVPGVAVHVIQRGNNRGACFFAEADYRFYLDTLSSAAQTHRCQIHAYVLMTNHVHLLMTPLAETSVSRLMQTLGRRYVLYVNHTYRRTGTLWEGRHKASLIDSEHYLLACSRYIELNPVRAAMVSQPEAYPWSSYRHHALAQTDALIDDHPVYQSLGRTPEERSAAYRALFRTHLDTETIQSIRNAANVGVPLGDNRFKEQIEAALERKIGYLHRGRPGKVGVSELMGEYRK